MATIICNNVQETKKHTLFKCSYVLNYKIEIDMSTVFQQLQVYIKTCKSSSNE